MFDKLPELENGLATDIKMALFHMAGYIVRKDEAMMIPSVIMKNMVTLPRTSIVEGYKFLEILLVNGHFIFYIMCNLLMAISDVYVLNMQRKHRMIMANVLFKNHCYHYSPRVCLLL